MTAPEPAPSRRIVTSSRTTLIVGGVSVALATALSLALPALAALPAREARGLPPCWAALGPLLAGLACAVLLRSRLGRIRRGALGPEHLGDLPGQIFLLFLAVGVGVIPLGQALLPWTALARRPAMLLLAAPSLVLAHALVLRFTVQGPLIADLERLMGSGAVSRSERRPLPGVLSLRRSLALAALACSGASLGLITAHAESRVRLQREELLTGHLEDLLEVVAAQLVQLPEQAWRGFLDGYPTSPAGWPLLAELDGRVLLPSSAATAAARLEVVGPMCRWAGTEQRCGIRTVGGRRLVVLASGLASGPGPVEELRLDLLLLGLGLLAVAGLLGWAIGRDTSQDFEAIALQLESMASEEEPDLGRPITVTSIDEVGDLTAALGGLRAQLATDLQGHRESLRRAREADRLQTRFFSDVSHALRTPLTTVHGGAQLLAEGLVGELPPADKQDVRVIHGSAQHLLALIKDIIDISVIESGHLTLRLEKIDAVALCREIVDAQQAQARQRAAEGAEALVVELEAEPELPPLVADPLRLRQIVQNLVQNAMSHTPRGSVTVGVKHHGDAALAITVRDTGEGISAADLPHIFERYRQAGSVRSRRSGSGLGLGITRQLVGLHGGEVTATSAVSEGTTFTVVLPLRGPGAGATA